MHIGEKIQEILKLRHVTKRDLGESIGLTGSSATYLTSRQSLDVETLQRIGIVLKYNFFKHYPVNEDSREGIQFEASDDRDKKIAALEKRLEDCVKDMQMQKKENEYLKKINELLEKKV